MPAKTLQAHFRLSYPDRTRLLPRMLLEVVGAIFARSRTSFRICYGLPMHHTLVDGAYR